VRIKVVTAFKELFAPFIESGIIGRAVRDGKLIISTHDLRDYSEDLKHKRIDDYLYGGGSGMLIKAPVLQSSLKDLKEDGDVVVAMRPSGLKLDTVMSNGFKEDSSLIIYCGRYEGFDQRFIDTAVDFSISIGDFVTMGGEIPAMAFIESIVRKRDGVLNSVESFEHDSFENGFLEEDQFTRPAVYKGLEVPAMLLSGNHQEIDKWRVESSIKNTYKYRPDLLKKRLLSDLELKYLKQGYKEQFCGSYKKN